MNSILTPEDVIPEPGPTIADLDPNPAIVMCLEHMLKTREQDAIDPNFKKHTMTVKFDTLYAYEPKPLADQGPMERLTVKATELGLEVVVDETLQKVLVTLHKLS